MICEDYCEDHQKEFEMTNYKRFLTLAEVTEKVLYSGNEGEHKIVIIPPEKRNGNVTDEEERDENNTANLANTELPNKVAGTPEVHKNSDGDNDVIIKNTKPKSKREKVIQSVNWKKNTNLSELLKGEPEILTNKRRVIVALEPIEIFSVKIRKLIRETDRYAA